MSTRRGVGDPAQSAGRCVVIPAAALPAALRNAEREGRLLTPASYAIPASIAACYDLQEDGLRARLSEGAHLVGYKMGLSSASARHRLGVRFPVHGYLLAEHQCTPHELEGRRLIAPRVEPEAAFIVGRHGVDTTQGIPGIAAGDASLAPALEIVDSRWESGGRTAGHLVVDDVSASAFVLGPRVPISSVALSDQSASLQVGCRRAVGRSHDVLGHPLASVLWLVNALSERGIALEPGQILLTGSWCDPVPAGTGDLVRADFGPLGRCEAHFGVVGTAGSV